jgi:hypothetical protein
MAHALTLTASSTGRAPVPTGAGPTLLVDEANAVMITVSPNPSSWDPEGLVLLRGGQRVATHPMSDGTRWVLMGDDRFGTFHARATAAGSAVESPAVRVIPAGVSAGESPAVRVVPATVSLRQTPAVAQPVSAPASPPWGTSPPVAPTANAAPPTALPASAPPVPSAAQPQPAAHAPGRAQPQPAAPAPSPVQPQPAPAPSAPTQGVVEVPLAEYDGRFAAVVAAMFSLLAMTVLAIVATQVISDLIIATPVPAKTATPDADSAARSARATSALLIGIGIILLLAATALAALDVRGRQRRDARASTALRGTQATLDKAPGILENPGRFRSTLALLITGIVVVMIGFLGQVHWS